MHSSTATHLYCTVKVAKQGSQEEPGRDGSCQLDANVASSITAACLLAGQKLGAEQQLQEGCQIRAEEGLQAIHQGTHCGQG